MKPDIFNQMVDKWPSSVVTTPQVKQFTGGLITGKTLGNLRSLGQSVPESIMVCRKRAYLASSLADWLRERSEGGVV